MSIDLDHSATQVHKSNHHHSHTIRADLSRIATFCLILGIHLVIMGPPCQPFSRAGNEGGFHDVRSAPIGSMINIATFAQPQVIIMENVLGFLYGNNGTWYHTLTSLFKQ